MLIHTGRSICIRIRLTPSGRMSTRSLRPWPRKSRLRFAAHREIHGRGLAMASRTIIGQAEGILMERLGIDPDQAFAYVRRVSQSENRKLLMICREIV